MRSAGRVELGLRENLPQFSLLVAVNALVGAMVGLERSTLPLIGEDEFGVGSSAAVLSFIVAFGLAKSFTNLGAGALAERLGRRRLLIAGWAIALPVPLLVGVAPNWGWVVAANLLLGVNQGLAWSMTVVMKIDLVGPERRGFALGLNEAAGYGGVAAAAAISGWLASEFAARDVLVVAAAAVAVAALAISFVFVRDTADHVSLEQTRDHAGADGRAPSLREAFRAGTFADSSLRSCSQAGLVNNLNDALAWGLVPLFLAANGATVGEIGAVAAIYPAVWGLGQIWTGHWSDSIGRKPLIVAGMLFQAAALALLAASGGEVAIAALAAAALGVGTALVYPTLIAAISDAVTPVARAPAVGVYRFWRDMGYVAGGLSAGLLADALDYEGAIGIIAGLTAASGLWVAIDLDAARARVPRSEPHPYDRHVGRYGSQLAQGLIELAGAQAGDRVLDVGCGTGQLTAALAGAVGGENVCALDSSAEMVSVCHSLIPAADVRVGSAEALPFPDDEFDAVLAQLVVNLVADPLAAVREMRRVVRPGEPVVACVWDDAEMPLLRSFWDAARAVAPEALAGVDDSAQVGLADAEQLRRWWAGAGLRNITLGELDVSAAYESFDDLWFSFASGVGYSGRLYLSLSPAEQSAVRSDAYRRLGCPDGRFRLVATARTVRGFA